MQFSAYPLLKQNEDKKLQTSSMQHSLGNARQRTRMEIGKYCGFRSNAHILIAKLSHKLKSNETRRQIETQPHSQKKEGRDRLSK